MGAGLAAPAPARVRPACGDRGRWRGVRVLGAPRCWRPASRAGDRALSPAAAYAREGGGLRGPGCPEPPRGRPRAGCRPSLARPRPELVTSGRRGPGSPARGGRRGRVCGGLPTRSRAGLAEPQPTSDPACGGPRGRAEGQRRRPRGAGAESGAGRRAVGEARGLRAEGAASGESSQPGEKVATRRRASGRRSSSRRSCLLPWMLNSCFVGAGSLPPPPPCFLASLFR